MEFKVATDEVMEDKDTILVCMRLKADDGLVMADNITDKCSECGWTIQMRPNAPKLRKKICMECAMDSFAIEGMPQEVFLSQTQLNEFKKRNGDT